MRPFSPRLRRGVIAALLPLMTVASAGTLAARAAENNSNNADLTITKVASASDAKVGDTITYFLTVTNNGPRPGTKAMIHDEVPSTIDVVSATVTRKSTPADYCDVVGRIVDCRIHGNVRDDDIDDAQVTIVGKVNNTAVAGREICNVATVTGNHDDPRPENNTSGARAACTNVVGPPAVAADLKISKVADPTTVSIGDVVTYTLTVENIGLGVAAHPTVTDLLPPNVELVSTTPGTPAPPSSLGCVGNDTIVSCSLAAIAPGGKAEVTIKVKPTPAAGGTTLTNNASVSASEDTNLENNRASATVTVRARADLLITKSADKANALIGEVLTYTIRVTNRGPNMATGVVVTDDIPNQAALQGDATASQGSCGKSDPDGAVNVRVTCSLGTLASDASATVTIKVKPTTKGYITNTASVVGNEEDLTLPNRSNGVTTAYVALTGGAFGESVDVEALRRNRVTSGPLASVTLPSGGGGPFTGSAVDIRVRGGLFSDLLRVELLRASTHGGRAANGDLFVASSADVANASLVNGLITVEGLHSDCRTDNAGGSSSSANVVKLRIAGVLVQVAAGPNSTITVPGVGELILNEQVTTGTGPLDQTRAVNALHLKLDGLLAKGDVILAHSDCGIDP